MPGRPRVCSGAPGYDHTVTHYPALIGVATFVIGTAIAVALFAALDVTWILLIGPTVGIACAAYAAYRTARGNGPGASRPT